ncbi:MAG: agmatinase [Planctomycetota bacterium]
MPVNTEQFLGLSGRECDYRRARYAILPVPYDATSSFRTGSRAGPQAVISASYQLEDFDEEYGREFLSCGIATLPPMEPNTAGPAEMHENIYRAARRLVRDGKFLIGLGGEHAISAGLVRAVRSRYKKLSVLQIDAHADFRDQYQGSPFSHACVMRRVWELGVPVTAVGIRSYSLEEHRFMRKNRLAPVTARQAFEDPDWIVHAVESLSSKVYVTVDIDGFDPAYAPGTGSPEPGGLDWFQVSDLLMATAQHKEIVAADVTEVLPLPGSVQTEFLAARLVYKLIAHVEANRAEAKK